MPIANYSVLAGRPTAGKVVSGASAHYQITMQAAGGPFTAAVNIQSVDGSEGLYAIEEAFTTPNLAGLMSLPMGMTALKGEVDGIHDSHMNQGNPKGYHGGENGVWQDGALLIHLPSKETWTAVFLAFQTESWSTDSAGNPEKA